MTYEAEVGEAFGEACEHAGGRCGYASAYAYGYGWNLRMGYVREWVGLMRFRDSNISGFEYLLMICLAEESTYKSARVRGILQMLRVFHFEPFRHPYTFERGSFLVVINPLMWAIWAVIHYLM